MLVCDDGDVVADSTRIIERLEAVQPEPPLYPADPAQRRRALELEEFFDEEFGPHARRMFFFEALDYPDYVVALFADGQRPATRALYRAAHPLNRAVMRFAMGIDAARTEESRKRVDAALDRIEAELRPSGYLAGDAFSVADLTAAALATPFLMPAEFSYPWPPAPEPIARWLRSQTGRPALAWAAEMYRRHRGRSAEVAA